VGDYQDAVHYATADGASATLTFTGTSVGFVTETNSDEGAVTVTLDGVSKGTVSAAATSRHAQQTVYSAVGLPSATHTLRLTKAGGGYLLVDGFDIGATC
jgi:hypothetical protein